MKPLIPTELDTPRLRLRTFALDDWEPLHRHYSDPDCTRFTFGRPLTEGESWRAMAGMAGHWMLRGFGPYALEDKVSGSLVGAAGLWHPGDFPETEIKWLLLREHWGRGFASEAVRAIQDVAATRLAMRPISLIRTENAASRRLATAVGATFEREIEFRDARWMAYRHPARAGTA
jgi:RimJ/RimL family protein N-acetyltransferase